MVVFVVSTIEPLSLDVMSLLWISVTLFIPLLAIIVKS
jgi:hypothetical protein